MAKEVWEVSKVSYCEHVKREAALEIQILYPIDSLPDPPRVLTHRCSLGMQCNLFAQPVCVWAGTNPAVDPFRM